MPELSHDEVQQALDIARALVSIGIPVFSAPPSDKPLGFALPPRWQQTPRGDASGVDGWQPGWALCAVMGYGLDLIDLDPRNGGVWPADTPVPKSYGAASTPSGGFHSFVRSLGVRSRDGVFPGIDVKAGMDGVGHGFVFLPPTVKPSKVTGEPTPYRWAIAPDIAGIQGSHHDASGAGLWQHIRALQDASGTRTAMPVGLDPAFAEFFGQREPQSTQAADRAIHRALAEAAEPAEPGGGYRIRLMRAALTLGGYVGAGHLAEEVAYEYLLGSVLAAWGAEADADDELWIQQGLRDGAARPFAVYQPGEQLVTGSDKNSSSDEPPWSLYRCLFGPFDPTGNGTDQGLADAALRFLHPVIRVARDTGSWLVRGQDRWRESPADLATWSVSTVSQLMPAGAVPIPKDHAERTPAHWQAVRYGMFQSSAGGGKVANKMRSLVSGPGHPVSLELAELDADASLLWAGGLPWDLRTGAVREDVDTGTPHLHSARYRPNFLPEPFSVTHTPLWDAFTQAVWPDAEIREWALTVLSVGFTGHSPRIMPVLYGEPGRGKTQIVALLCDLLGTYGGEADQKLIVAPEAHGSVVYSLKGKRLAYIDEPAPTARDKVERVKLLTGGGRMTGNQMRCNPVSWDPTHTLVLMQNDPPELTDGALRDRARVIHCDGDPVAVAAARAAIGAVDSNHRSAQWAAEAPCVLAKMMGLAGAWLRDADVLAHRNTPAVFRSMVDEMVASQDPVNRWMEERTNPAEPGTASTVLHNDFGTWFSQHPEYRRKAVPSSIVFGRRLTELGVGATRTSQERLRSLELKTGNGWFGGAPTPSGFTSPVTDDDRSNDGSGGTSVTPDNPRSAPVLITPVTDMTDASPVDSNNAYIIDTDVKCTGNRSGAPDLSPVLVNMGADLALFGDDGSVTASVTAPVGVLEPMSAAGLSRTAAAKARKAAERAAKVAEVAGPLIELPALVVRGQYPVAVDHFGAERSVTGALRTAEGHLTVDCETTGYPIGHPDYALRTVQLGTAELAVDFDPECGKCRAVITTLLGHAEILHAHNAAADLAPLAHARLVDYEDAWSRMWDTVLPAKLADPTSTGGDPALKAAASAVLGADAVSTAADAGRDDLFKAARWSATVAATDPVEKSGWYQVDPRCATMITYAASDVLDTAALALVLPAPDPAVHARERKIQAIVSRPAFHGFPLDRERVLEQNALHENVATTLHTRITAELGIDNPGSPAQVATALLQQGARLALTKGGKPSVAKDVLEPLQHSEGPVGDAARLVLEWRHYDTALKLLLRPWKVAVVTGDGRIRPTVYTLGADTGRMSCVRPNMQQVSKKGGMRECINADPGYSLISADFSGVELRVAAALSGDQVLRQMIADDVDLHREIATQVFGAEQADANRTLAKRIVFGRIYGGGVETLAKQAGVSQSIASSAVDVMDSITPTLAAWSEQVRKAIRAGHRAFTTYSGRVVHLDPKLPHKGPNYLIQGTARELLADAILAWERTEFGGGLIMPVHDEIVAMVPTEQADRALVTLLECMTNDLNGIPIVAAAGGPPAQGWHSG